MSTSISADKTTNSDILNELYIILNVIWLINFKLAFIRVEKPLVLNIGFEFYEQKIK